MIDNETIMPEDENSSELYYTENGKRVFTEEYHRRRGFCCGNGCRHCAYEPKYLKYNTELAKKE